MAGSDNEASPPSTPAGSVASTGATDMSIASITTVGSADDTGRGHPSSRDSDDVDANSAMADKHPKGKRKRTAAKDKAILEAAYKSNAKPDKGARLELVERVSLNEKEVQIWFQNRRQNDRRKSRPLSPQEIAALRSGSMQILSSDPYYASYAAAAVAGSPFMATPVTVATDGPARSSAPIATQGLAEEHGRERDHSSCSSASSSSSCSSSSFRATGITSMGYLANRWNLGSSFWSGENTAAASAASSVAVSPRTVMTTMTAGSGSGKPPPPVRISLSLDGRAELVPQGEPSPPRLPAAPGLALAPAPMRPLSAAPPLGPAAMPPRSRPGPVLLRSHSAAGVVTLPPLSALTRSLPATPALLPPRLARGRSRDAHAWELCAIAADADIDPRDELTAHAENEASGSALAPIGLLRSAGVLQPSAAARRKLGGAVPRPRPLRPAAAAIGMARQKLGAPAPLPLPPSSKIDVAMLLSPSGDSDKENWSPVEDQQQQQECRQPIQPRPRRPLPSPSVLLSEDHRFDDGPASPSSRRLLLPRILHAQSPQLMRRNSVPPLRALLGKRRPGDDGDGRLDIYEDGSAGGADGENVVLGRRVRRRSDEDVERLMRADVSPSKRGDFDCATGLLWLSKGNWR